MSFEDDEQIVILNDGSSGEKAPTFVAGRIQIEVNNLMEAPPKETRFKVLLELKESGDIEGRHGLDLVMVIDISGSMHEGGKLDKLKIATILVVEKLSPVDRFSVVIFFDSSIRLFPLRQITEDSKAEIIEEIRDLNVKNSDKNIAEDLRMALKVLNDRHFTHGRVGAIMLFSDGAENKGKAAEVDVSKVPVHTFDFDASHDQRVLLEIAQKSNGGTFSDLQNEDNFLSAFSQWLARLLTIVVQDLRVTVKQVDGDSKIMNVLAGNSPIKNENSAVTISYGDLYGKEVRKVQVELLLPNIIGSGPKALDVLQITCSYSDEYGKERFEADPIFITVTRTWGKEIRREEVIEQDAGKKRLLIRYGDERTYEWLILQFIYQNSIITISLWDLPFNLQQYFLGRGNGTKKPHHYLDLYRRILLTIPRDSHNCFDTLLSTLLSFVASTLRFVFSPLGVLISFVIERFDSRRRIYMIGRRMHSFRNIQELKTAGIKLKPTYSLRRVFFHSRFFITGELSLPALVVNDSTERMLLNLVAYEMCFNKEKATNSEDYDEKDSWVNSYVNLLDVVIDNEQDVKDLRAAGIIQNHLSSDSQVAEMINRMGSNCFPPSKDTYKHVKKKIEKHYRRRCAIWMAQVCHSHFSSPWTILALFTATAVLGLTTVQTYYAVNPKN